MRIFKILPIVAIALALAACKEDENKQTSSVAPATTTTQASDTSQATAPAPVKAPWVWPGEAVAGVVYDSNQTRKNFMVVYDGSGSMDYEACGSSSRNRHEDGVRALKEFVKAVPADANLGLYVFDANGRGVRVPLGTNNRTQFLNAVGRISVGQGTPLKSSIREGYDALTKQGHSQLGYGRYSLIIVTDGEASNGQNPTNIVNEIVDKTPVEIHTVGLCFTGKHSLNQAGRTFYTAASNPEQLINGLKDALAEAENVTADDFK